MTDSVPHDDPAVETVRARVERAGRTDRPKVVVPDLDPREEPVRLVLDGRTRHATFERGLDDRTELRGAYDNARMAREGDGEDRLRAWVTDRGLDFGRSVHLDRVADDLFGLRAPGERAVYTVAEQSSSLRDIARDLDG